MECYLSTSYFVYYERDSASECLRFLKGKKNHTRRISIISLMKKNLKYAHKLLVCSKNIRILFLNESDSDAVKAFLFFQQGEWNSRNFRVSIFGNGSATIVQFKNWKFAILSEFCSLRHLRERVM